MSESLSFSVVINTDGRREHLERTLESLRFLSYDNFEACVVYGPTPDGTKELLQQRENEIKIAACQARNIARSRNIGIALAAGDIIAFIDDDAIPDPEWLTDLAKSYRTAEVAAAGGFVYDNTGVAFQTEFETTDRLGYADSSWQAPAPHTNFPFSAAYPHLLGTNCSIRKSALLEIGGFDEEYEYFLEETDVCCRLNDAGFKIDQRSDAFVHHKYAPSDIRNEHKVLSNWYPLIKNRIYFGLRNARYHHSLREIVEAGLRDINKYGSDLRRRLADGVCVQEDLDRFNAQSDAAVEDGIVRGLQPKRKLLSAETIAAFRSPFLSYKAGPARSSNRKPDDSEGMSAETVAAPQSAP
ncbi:glycosyltransferase [Roseiarcaceae bacterium H3SJ34-1]|uniref:glycosyltransferase family 2 protein n=1 Tax=Terripilifer ovatus TaxID=3032367 RepID=UPI003AB97587|nr:glycosyltransferase [Roseiarcaceae bacterium H3SJ34-1]